MNPIMWDESTQMLFVTNESGIFAVELYTVSMGPMTRVDSIPETARRWEPLSNIPRILSANAITGAVRRAEKDALARGDAQ